MAQKTSVFASLFWISAWLANNVSSIIGNIAYPYFLHILKKYKFKKSINFIKDKKTITKIIGYKSIVEQVNSLITTMKEQKETKIYKQNDGILFFGPSGCGKTNFVKTIAYEAGIPVLTILAKNLISDTGTVTDLDLIFEVVRDYILLSWVLVYCFLMSLIF